MIGAVEAGSRQCLVLLGCQLRRDDEPPCMRLQDSFYFIRVRVNRIMKAPAQQADHEIHGALAQCQQCVTTRVNRTPLAFVEPAGVRDVGSTCQ